MHLIKILIILLVFLQADATQAASYTPVDQLESKSSNLGGTRRFHRQRHYNPRLLQHRLANPRLWHSRRLNPRFYSPQMLKLMQRKRDPNIGKWVSPPPQYLAAAAGPYKAPTVVALNDGGAQNNQPSSPPGDKNKKNRLFGTVEFGRPLSSLPGWNDVIRRNAASPIFRAEKYFNKSANWENLKSKASAMPPMEQLRFVNNFWNSWPYREDMPNWGQEDYWAAPAEFLRKSGDCEDYAIVKYFTLKELGFDPHKMRIVVLRDTIRNLAHAVLAVYMNDDIFILDNLSKSVLSHRILRNYSPQYSVNEYGRWAHIKSKSAKR